jgi:predicted  nucleic acid-binding Zn-ribbon protein
MMGDEINIERPIEGKLKEEKKALKTRCSLLSLEVSTLRVRIDKLKIALQTLYDEQNGPPLENDKEDWHSAMRMAEEALRER